MVRSLFGPSAVLLASVVGACLPSITANADVSPLLAPTSSLARADHFVATSVFHWYSPNGGQLTGPWRPLEGRSNWTGQPDWWKTQVKQMMSANIDVLYVHLIPHMDLQRLHLFQALSELRREGYRTPKVAPFLDPMITWDILPGIDLSTDEGKDNFAVQYIRFFQQYFQRNTDEYADDYLLQIDERVVLDTWHIGPDVAHPSWLSRSDLESRLSAPFAEAHPVFENGIHMITTAGNDLRFADEQVHQFQVHAYFKKYRYNGITSVQLKGGYWDQNIRDPGYLLPRDGGSHYEDAWEQVFDDPAISRVYIESWNEYDEGSGIYAANPGDPYIRSGSAADRLGSDDVWSDANDPYEYIRTTAEGARRFNETPDRDAAVLTHDFPKSMRPGETRIVTVTLRNEGDIGWTGASGFAFEQYADDSRTSVFSGPVRVDDSKNEIAVYGSVFRGRPMTVQFQVTAPEESGRYDTAWRMRQDIVPPEFDNATVFNWHANAGEPHPMQGPGLVVSVETTPGLSGDSPQDAFGSVGGIEPESFIFRDGGVVDNGNLILGDGGETVDHIRFRTEFPVTLDGYSLNLPTDYAQQNAYRSTALVRFSIDGAVVDFFDNDGRNGSRARLFSNGPLSGSEFLLELTRVTTGGPRVMEIDAILDEGWPIPFREWFGDTLEATINVAIPGDLNFDGRVTAVDLDLVRANWGRSVPVGALDQGDADYDGTVGNSDLELIRANWGRVAGTAPTAVPEPTVLLLAFGFFTSVAADRCQRRKKRNRRINSSS